MNLKELIKNDLKLTQKKFAEELGVYENTVNNWCVGKTISLENIKKITDYYKMNNIPTNNLAVFLLDYFGVIPPIINKTENVDNKKVEKLNEEINKLKIINKQNEEEISALKELNKLYGKEIKYQELKQWSPSGTARRILDSKDFNPIIEKLLENYSEQGIFHLKSELSNIIGKEIKDMILKIHNEVLNKEKERLKEKLKKSNKSIT